MVWGTVTAQVRDPRARKEDGTLPHPGGARLASMGQAVCWDPPGIHPFVLQTEHKKRTPQVVIDHLTGLQLQ